MLPPHYHRPVERPFTATERDTTTILFGGLTGAHDRLIEAVFHACGYRCRRLPTPDLAAFHLGREYCNTGQCNPTYFTIGSLLGTLLEFEAQGYSRQQIIDQFVFFTAGSCGPCRFGMYESEYRLALHNAGFDGFRVMLFQQDDGIAAGSGEPGLKFTLDFGLGALNAFNLGDILPWLERLARRHRWLEETINCLGKLHFHLYSEWRHELLRQCRARLNRIDIDRTRVKPIVKE